jgi:VWFA-related protein
MTGARNRSVQQMALAAACMIGTGLAATGQRPSFTTSSDLVVVPTVVVDRKGAMVRGLDAERFQVFEDGHRVPVETFAAPDEMGSGADGRFIVLVLDNVGTPVELGTRMKTIARKFADRMGPADRLSAIALDGGRSSGAGTAREVLAAIDRFSPAFGDSIRSNAQNAQHGLEMIGSLVQQLSEVQHRRKVLVFIGSAAIFSPNGDSAFSDRGAALSPQYFDAVRITGQQNVTVYVIDPEGFGNGVGAYDESFAEQTGGQAWVNTNNFDRAVNQIWQESGSYYLLGYRPPLNDHRLHKIEVKVNLPNTTVRARKARG